MIPGWNTQTDYRNGRIQNLQLDSGVAGNASESFDIQIMKQLFSVFTFEIMNHTIMI